jgi:small subunit ribosomal protein S3
VIKLVEKDISKLRYFVEKERKNILLKEWLAEKLKSAGFSSVKIITSPTGGIGTKIIVKVLRPGLVIGRRGAKIKQISEDIEKIFGYDNVRLLVYEVEEPELDPEIMAWQIERQLLRGVRYRRVGFWALRVISSAGAAGVEIVISGKLRTVRSAYEKFTAGVVLKSGELASRLVKTAKRPVLTKMGIIGVKVSIMPVSLQEYLSKMEAEEDSEVSEEAG